jgi:hypothetical protein
LFLAPFASQTLVFLIKARDLYRNPTSPFLRALCLALGLSAVSSFVGIPVVLTFMETTSGVPGIWLLGPLVATCAAIQATVLLWSSPLPEALHNIYIRMAAYAGAIAVMVVLVLKARGHITTTAMAEHQQDPEALWGLTPFLRDAVLLYFAALIFTFADVAWRLVRNAKLVDRRWLRRGLIISAVACLVYLIYCVAMAGYFVALRGGITLPILHDGALVAATVSPLTFSVGVTMPVLGPRWERMRAYRRLEPLWLALRRANPGVVLEPPWSTRVDAWSPRSLDFRLYRRVIEIRDGALALRPYFDPAVTVAARRLATSAQLPAQEVETTIEAAQLTLAIRARLAGREPYQGWKQPVLGTGDDLDAELTSLVPLAQAFAASPIVRAVAAEVSQTPGAVAWPV